jgi:hypothetical protein
MNYFLERRTSRGLVLAREWVVWGNPVGYVTLEGAGLNAFVFRALTDAAFLGRKAGENTQAEQFEKAARDLAAAFNQVLWDEQSGSFFSGYYDPAASPESAAKKPDLKIENHLVEPTVYPAIFALERGIVSPEHRASVLKYLYDHREPKGQVMIYYYLHKLLYGFGGSDYDREILQCYRQKWRGMMASPWECSWEDFNGGSHAHCYGMFPGYFLSSYVLGIRRDAPVAEKQLIIEPHLGDLTNAEGTVVTEFGPVPVSWKRSDGEILFKFEVPKNVHATLRLSDGEAGTLILEGKKVRAETQGCYLVAPIRAGVHQGRLNVRLPVLPVAAGVSEQRIESDSPSVQITLRRSDAPAGLEADVVRSGLVSIASASEEKVAHAGGGADASALFNGTTQNGLGGDETLNDGKTFRGYGAGSVLTITLTKPSNISRIVTFAGHLNGRASQNYAVFAAQAGTPGKFAKLASVSAACADGASELRLSLAVTNVVALRFEFQDGPDGFNVYREISMLEKH